MAHIAIVVSRLSGRMNSSFELISRLEKEGHRLTVLCQPTIKAKVEKQGFACVEIPELNFYINNPKLGDHPSLMQKFAFHFKNFPNHYKDGKSILHLEEHKKILASVNPDLFLADVELHDLIFTAAALNIPITLFTTWFSDTISLKLPPIRTSIIPGQGFKGSSLGIALAWIKIRLMVWGRLYINKFTFKDYKRATLKKYAKEIGFPTKDLMINTLPPFYSFKKLPILSFTIQELDFPHQAAANLIYVGPMVYEGRSGKDEDVASNERLSKIFELKNTSNKKLIYCSVSSFVKGDLTFLKKVLTAVGDESEWEMILTLGGNIESEKLGQLPDNVHVFGWVPQLKVLEQVDCSINHSGVNVINECLHFLVPMLAYSGKMFDQNGNAARMEYHGLGIRGDKDIDSVDLIKKNIQRILSEPDFKDNIRAFNSLYQNYRKLPISNHLFQQTDGLK